MLFSCAAIVHRQSSMGFPELAVYVGVLGTGLGPLYSQTMMALEELVPVTKRASGVLYVYHTIGFLIIPWGLGQVADQHPYLLFTLCAVAAGLLVVCFAVLALLQNQIRKLVGKI